MGLNKHVEIEVLESMQSGMAQFYTPLSCHETMLVQVPPRAIDDLFVHHFQTDRLLVVRGSFVLVVLQNRQYRYLPLSDRHLTVITIPPGVPHGALNFSDEPCLVVNAAIRHGKAIERDYRPMKPRLAYDLDAAKAALDRELATAIGA
ncbi:cupin domain-containing protein [Oxynema sp. CENA135]|jgi:uncharacterized RmlC-like cupin family protein|uniref:cupin domain-containing protein n=1 Tax=Oxynema sp. CENA135 TaxID=984206 RepID=UPI00190C898A|nr:cupin domain-containing protein [Oxynema sp. CENA135]MBK4731786.1 cupin domain-containing protein [Oxynema sp. CENA135]